MKQGTQDTIRESFLERINEQLRVEVKNLETKLTKFEKCALPQTLTKDNFEIASNDRCQEQVALQAGEYLIKAFAEQDSLYSICNYVTKELAHSEGGHWLCTIWPFDVEVGLGINDYTMFLALDFKNANLDYRVIIAKTSDIDSESSANNAEV